jgi:hypothetical protein
MTITTTWRQTVLAALTLATLALVLYTIGAPYDMGG